MSYLRLIYESIRFALGALLSNLLRTILSLLGVTIGIFAIIAVFTFVDSLEKSINESLNFLGSDNIMVQKWPYGFGGGIYPWWKYISRPYPTLDEYKYLSEHLNNHQAISIYAFRRDATVKSGNNSSDGVNITGASYGHKDVFEIPLEDGRYFTTQEMNNGNNVCLIGYRIADELFPYGRAVGKKVKIKGLTYQIIGTIEEEGESLLGAPSNDDNLLIPFQSFRKLYYTGKRRGVGATISVKGFKEDTDLQELEGELRGLMRRKRGLKPKQDDDFALNRPEVIANFIGKTFDIIGIAGWIIGSFSILVGGFGIANIMFVSVRERTNIIGIQKSLGAKNYFILYQFLFESVFLSILGGAVGILLVYLLTFIDFGDLELTMSMKNIAIGLGVSAIIGTLSGIVPAALAARLDPVEAIRS